MRLLSLLSIPLVLVLALSASASDRSNLSDGASGAVAGYAVEIAEGDALADARDALADADGTEAAGAGAEAAEASADAPPAGAPRYVLPDDLAPGETGHYGAEFTLADDAAVDLATALETCLDTGELCRVRARMANVCQSRGCWFTLDNEGVTPHVVRVRMQDYSFFVPRNAAGAEVEIEARLRTLQVPVEAEEGAEAAPEHETVLKFMSTGVRVTMPGDI